MVVAEIKITMPPNGRPTIILGANGMLGHAFQVVSPQALFFTKEVDITDEEGMRSLFRRFHPSLVINAAAYTDVDGCEENRDHAFLVNGEAPGYIASACLETGATLVHFSTDYIFGGEKEGYIESDHPHPINIYGRSKLIGEERIRETFDEYRIVRTSWLFGPDGRNFVDTMLRLSHEQESVRVVDDQVGRPTYTRDLAAKALLLPREAPGIYHVTNEGTCTWFEFARQIIPNVVPCTSDEIHRKAKRPRCSVLLNTKTSPLRHWKEALAEYLTLRGRELQER
jgi:dTDP-4-dehydrorhamnose reductase